MAKKKEIIEEIEQQEQLIQDVYESEKEEKEVLSTPLFIEKSQGQVRYKVQGKQEITFLLDGKETTLPVVDDVVSIDVKPTYTIEWL